MLSLSSATTQPFIGRAVIIGTPPTQLASQGGPFLWLLGRERLVSRPLRLLGLGVSSLREPVGRPLVLL